MCGIVAVYSRREPVPAAVVERATRRLHHRGPDGQRQWLSADGRVGLGHARLSIIDLTTGDQPIANETETARIIVNGEFYGYEAIQKELEGTGHRLRTRSDSEIALHLYEDMGIQSLHRLRGEFALVIWDQANRTMIAARDRFGIKPMFYAFHNETLYVASEVKALFAAGVPARWDTASVYQCVELGGHQTRTLFDGVFQVPPGHYLIASEKHLQLHQYWDFNYPTAEAFKTKRSDADYVAEFRHVFEEAVRIRLRADVPVGCYLSGGLDSCAVLGLAAKHHPDPIRAFTLTFDHADYDEGAIAKAMAVRDAGYKVVLTGEGSDEILGGYAHFRRDMVLYGGNGQNAQEAELLLQELDRANPVSRGLLLPDGQAGQLGGVKRQLGFVPSWIETFSARSGKLRVLMSDEFRAEFGSREDFQGLLSEIDIRNQLSGRDALNQSLYLWAKSVLPMYILTMLGDRMEMAHSIEGRVPFLDHHVVEVLRSQPPAMKIRAMNEKFVLREAVRDVITDTVYRRQKHPFLSPPATLNPEQKLHSFVQDALRGPQLASIPYFDRKKVIALLDGVDSMDEGARVTNDPVLMTLASMCVLQQGFQLAA